MLYYLLKLVSKIICLLPYDVVLFIGSKLGFFYYLVAKERVNLAKQTIKERLEISEQEADIITMNMCKKFGMTVMEVLYTPALNSSNIRSLVEFEREEYVKEVLAEKKGIIALSMHMDNWEWSGAAMKLYGYPVASLTKRQRNESFNRFLHELRTGSGVEVFDKESSEIISAIKFLRKGNMLGFVADQDGGKEGIFLPFLGKLASTPVGPAFFAKRFKAPIVPIFIVRRPEGGHKFIVYDKFYYEDTGNEEQDMYNCTKHMTEIMEEVIRKYPDNWLWFQRRWNTRYKKRKGD